MLSLLGGYIGLIDLGEDGPVLVILMAPDKSVEKCSPHSNGCQHNQSRENVFKINRNAASISHLNFIFVNLSIVTLLALNLSVTSASFTYFSYIHFSHLSIPIHYRLTQHPYLIHSYLFR